MQYSQIPAEAPNAVASGPPTPPTRSYSLKHVLAGAVGAALLTALTLHAVVYRPVAYAPVAAYAPRALPVEDGMYATSRGFRPNNSCANYIGKGKCAGMLEEGHSFVYRQCAGALGGATPTVCNCGGFGMRGGGEKPYVLRSEMRGAACACEFHTGTPGQSVWTMELKCQ